MKKKQQAHPLQPFTYDQNGDTLSDGVNTYQWDAENRLITINYPGSNNFTSFTYDGQGNRVKIVETTNNVVTSTKQFIFVHGEMGEARDGSGNLLNQFFSTGQTISGTSYFYSRDHLGSVREVIDSTGNVQAVYSYDLYGAVTRVRGSLASDFQYAGYYLHAPSGLFLTANRAYSSALGRWISRDPSGIGLNLYEYVNECPTCLIDPSGLCREGWKLIVEFHVVVAGDSLGQHGTIFLLVDGEVDDGWSEAEKSWFGGTVSAYIGGNQSYSRKKGDKIKGPTIPIDHGCCESLEKERSRIQSAVDQVQASNMFKHNYFWWGLNSNSWAYTVLFDAGYSPPDAPKGVNAPGWGLPVEPFNP